jgi:hypothetical protein
MAIHILLIELNAPEKYFSVLVLFLVSYFGSKVNAVNAELEKN